MKTLTLIRHAKSSWKNPELADIARPLNKRGLKNAPEMGRRLIARGNFFSAIYTSPAERATMTANLIIESYNETDNKPKLIVDASLYTHSYEILLDWLRSLDKTSDRLALIGHNPAITDLVNFLTLSHISNIPTCGTTTLALDIKKWEKIGAGKAQLIDFDYPKKLN